jgi:hypothetical protein
MRQWTSKSDYTAIVYEGIVPSRVTLSSEGIEIPPRQREARPESPVIRNSGGMVPALKLSEELQKTARNYKRDLLPSSAVLGMVNRTTESALQDRIDTVRANVADWSDPPHVEFANCTLKSPEDVKRFVEIHGFGLSMVADPGLRFLPPKAITVTVKRLRQDQTFLRESWGQTEQTQPLKDSFMWRPDDVDFTNGKPRIRITDIWDYILVLFLIDLSAGRLRVCANPGCTTLKYFVKERRNQKFCSVQCKNSFHVNLWLANLENRKAWNADRRKAK